MSKNLEHIKKLFGEDIAKMSLERLEEELTDVINERESWPEMSSEGIWLDNRYGEIDNRISAFKDCEGKPAYYELCFYHDEDHDDPYCDIEKAVSYVVKTEIPPTSDVIDPDIALEILFGENPDKEQQELIRNFTAILPITEDDAIKFFNVEDLTEPVEGKYGIYYKRPEEV